MRRFAAWLILALATPLVAQYPPTPRVSTCPAAAVSGAAYTPINPPANVATPASISATTYTDPAPPGTYCYIVAAWAIVAGSPNYQESVPSNIAGPFVVTAGFEVVLSWSPPDNAALYAYTYIVSRAPAILAPVPGAPTLTGSVAAQ
jgi:hypothetical protein